KAAGEVSPPSRFLTGPATPRRSVCAPAALAFSFYRRPILERRSIMWLTSWLRNRTANRAPRGRTQHRPAAPRFHPQLNALEDRCLPSFGSPITTAVYQPTALVTADVNGDGKPDLITLSNSADVEVWLGKGNGHFSFYRQLIIGGT